MERQWGNLDISHIFFFSISYHEREYERQDLQSSENHNITFLTLRSQNGVEPYSATLSYKRLKQYNIIFTNSSLWSYFFGLASYCF